MVIQNQMIYPSPPLIFFLAHLGQGNVQGPSMSAVRSAAFKTTGQLSRDAALELRGEAELHSAKETFAMVFDGQDRFRIEMTGPFAESWGFDGHRSWSCGPSGTPHTEGFVDAEKNRMLLAVFSGSWARPDSSCETRITSHDKETTKVEISLKRGTVKGTLTVSRATNLPVNLSTWGSTGTDVWKFDKWTRSGTFLYPARCVLSGGELTYRFDIKNAFPKSRVDDVQFVAPTTDPSRISISTTKSQTVELKRILGHLFVHPLLNGKDEGWFFLDTGSDVMVIDNAVASSLGAKPVGKDQTSGAVATLETPFYRGISFSLGSVTLNDPTYIAIDLGSFSKIFGIKISGICGYDFISAAILDIDPTSEKLTINPVLRESDGIKWTPISFNSNVPMIRAEFEGGRTGDFSLDTGSDSTVDFFGPTISRYELRKGRELTNTRSTGAGGAVQSQRGKIDYFELAGKRFEKPTVGFQSGKVGAFANPYVAGNIGMGFLGKYRLIIDYRNERVAFIPRPTP